MNNLLEDLCALLYALSFGFKACVHGTKTNSEIAYLIQLKQLLLKQASCPVNTFVSAKVTDT